MKKENEKHEKIKNEENEKNEKNEEKNKKKRQKNGRKKSRKKKEKRAQRGLPYHPRWVQKLIFHIRTVKRNRNEIEAQKTQILSTQQRQRK